MTYKPAKDELSSALILEQESPNEGILKNLREGGDGFWLTVGKHSVYLRKIDDGLVVRIYQLGREASKEAEHCFAPNWEERA